MLYCVLDTHLLIRLLCIAHKEPGRKYDILYSEEMVLFTAVSLSQGVERRMIGLMKKELDDVGVSGRGLRSRYESGTTRIQSGGVV
jgi:hypothetical protein